MAPLLWIGAKGAGPRRLARRVGGAVSAVLDSHPKAALSAGLLVVAGVYGATLQAGGSLDDFFYAHVTQSPVLFYHPNHYIPHILMGLFYRIAIRFSSTINSLTSTHLLNAAFGTINVWLFFGLARRILRHFTSALLLTLVFGFSCWTWKFATSGEVYTSMMTFLLLTLRQWAVMVEGRTWTLWEIGRVALLANLCVLAHNVTSLIAFAYGVPLVIHARAKFFKFTTAGLVLFVLLQGAAAYANGLSSVKQWWDHNFYYWEWAKNNHVISFDFPKNIFIVLRDGTLTPITGFESNLFRMIRLEQGITVGLYAYFWAMVGSLLMGARGAWQSFMKEFKQNLFFQAVLGHWVVIGAFTTFWAVGNDESLHWLTPFFLLSMAFVIRESGWARGRVVALLALTVPILLVTSFGTSDVAQAKIRALAFPRWNLAADLKRLRLEPGDILVICAIAESDVPIRYFQRTHVVSNPLQGLKTLPRTKRKVYVHAAALDASPLLFNKGALRRVNESFYTLELSRWVWPREFPPPLQALQVLSQATPIHEPLREEVPDWVHHLYRTQQGG